MKQEQLFKLARGYLIVLYALSGGRPKEPQSRELVRHILGSLKFEDMSEEEIETLRKQAVAGKLDLSGYLS